MILLYLYVMSRVSLKRVKVFGLSYMSDSIKSLVRNYFAVQISNLWEKGELGVNLEKWAIFDPF